MHKTFSFVLQGEFPDKNSQEDSHIGVAPVDAFPAQNKFGKFILAVNYYFFSIQLTVCENCIEVAESCFRCSLHQCTNKSTNIFSYQLSEVFFCYLNS